MDQAGARASRGARTVSCARARGDRRRFQAGAKSSASYDGAGPRGHLWLGEEAQRDCRGGRQREGLSCSSAPWRVREWQVTRDEKKDSAVERGVILQCLTES